MAKSHLNSHREESKLKAVLYPERLRYQGATVCVEQIEKNIEAAINGA